MKLLIVEDNQADVALIRHQLAHTGDDEWHIEHVTRAHDAGVRLSSGDVDLVLLDLNLPDATGLETLRVIRAVDHRVPVVVLTGLDNEMMALAALKQGAQDYLVKGEATGRWLMRAIKYTGQRNELQKELWELALFDELTGLYNRRGFRLMAEQECRALERASEGLLLLAVNLDGLKRINDTHGHAAGDAALRLVARALRQGLRRADIVARVGGDEFLGVAHSVTQEGIKGVIDRFHSTLRRLVEESSPGYEVSASSGWAFRPGNTAIELDEMLQEADRTLYRAKDRARRSPGLAPSETAVQ